MSSLVGSCYAAARKQLEQARVAQLNAIYFGSLVYRAGRRGRDARMMRAYWDKSRRTHLAEALKIRAKIRALRSELTRLATSAYAEVPS